MPQRHPLQRRRSRFRTLAAPVLLWLTATRVTKAGTIEVLVGEERQSFSIHHKLLVAKCPYLETRLKDAWNHTKDEPIILEDIDSSGFEVVVDWMYLGQLPSHLSGDASSETSDTIATKAYKVADRLVMPALQNDLMDCMLTELRDKQEQYTFKKIFGVVELELSHTPLYDMVLRSSVKCMCEDDDEATKSIETSLERLEKYPWVLVDVIVSSQKYRRDPWEYVELENWCDYHIHPDGERCVVDNIREAPPRKKVKL